MKCTPLFLLLVIVANTQAEPIIVSWYTEGSNRYARIWATQGQESIERGGGGKTSLTTWDSADYSGVMVGDQPLPAYAGIQGISFSNEYVYIKSTGLATNTMGPWILNDAQTQAFPSFPGNAAILYRFPRTTSYERAYEPVSRALTNVGSCGLFVDGVPLFNTSDTFSYDTSAGGDQKPTNSNTGDGYWNRDAFTNEGVTFDAGNAHQAMEQFHYHASPTALRSALGDSVDYDPAVVYKGIGRASPYSENFNGSHSPIIAWVNDGLPMYGPYGYGDPLDPTSPVRRMVSGYQKRDGSNGSIDLRATGRTTLPQWQVSQGKEPTTVLNSSFYGPPVSETFTLGHYIEDYCFKGDLISDRSHKLFEVYEDPSNQGAFDLAKHYDLNEFNVRWCITPEFPRGTWAYFTNVEADGTPAYPYNLAYQYFGDANMAEGIAIDDIETLGVTVHFPGAVSQGPINESIEADIKAGTVTITWESIEGGSYRVETSEALDDWETSEVNNSLFVSDEIMAIDVLGTHRFYRLTRTGVEAYDETEFSITAGVGRPPGGGPPMGGGQPLR